MDELQRLKQRFARNARDGSDDDEDVFNDDADNAAAAANARLSMLESSAYRCVQC
jgi:hypothetical protein